MLCRCIPGETIAHSDKIFSEFEPPTRMISKGKAGVPFELGAPLSIVEDQDKFLLGFDNKLEGVDAEAINPLVDHVMKHFPTLDTLSTEKGFWSPEVYAYQSSKLALAAIPKNGRLYKEEKERQGGSVCACPQSTSWYCIGHLWASTSCLEASFFLLTRTVPLGRSVLRLFLPTSCGWVSC